MAVVPAYLLRQHFAGTGLGYGSALKEQLSSFKANRQIVPAGLEKSGKSATSVRKCFHQLTSGCCCALPRCPAKSSQ